MRPTTLATGFLRRLRSFRRDDRGGTAIEYALIAAGIGACIAAAVWSLGEKVNAALYEKLGNLL